eukprot:CAMPEP_0114532346 /NCGR_PEP_ID=MMETSP0109-20121206/26614_1 /TAXON_ID=29199 /ORGANISM="Chlorarachnion reptans, Strain CCCM449" /LENGTH=759 /DNA_ID=CAMNT_0001715399 /DNA_START=323 /DNA_END=2606 /DNA_ORIENTATION=+
MRARNTPSSSYASNGNDHGNSHHRDANQNSSHQREDFAAHTYDGSSGAHLAAVVDKSRQRRPPGHHRHQLQPAQNFDYSRFGQSHSRRVFSGRGEEDKHLLSKRSRGAGLRGHPDRRPQRTNISPSNKSSAVEDDSYYHRGWYDLDVEGERDEASMRQMQRDWDRGADNIPAFMWILFIFTGCALTSPDCMFGHFQQSAPNVIVVNGGNDEPQCSHSLFKNLPSTSTQNSARNLEGAGSLLYSSSSKKSTKSWEQATHHLRQDRTKGASHDDDPLNRERRKRVKSAFKHAWQGYEKNAFGHDEVRPTTNETNDSWGGFGVTLFDSLDTMLIMGLEDEYHRAIQHVYRTSFDKDYGASFFETAIRYLGGMLGAYALQPDQKLLEKARDLGERLLKGFHATRMGMPQSVINLRTGSSHNHHWNSMLSILSEVGSIQLEFAYLSNITGDPRFHNTARAVFSEYNKLKSPLGGLFPVNIDPDDGTWGNRGTKITMGGLADSFYEYLLKLYLLTGMVDTQVLGMYNRAMQSMREHLVRITTDKTEAFLTEYVGGRHLNEMEHLSCFVPGMLALGTTVFNPSLNRRLSKLNRELSPEEIKLKENAREHLVLADQILRGCLASYDAMPTGLGPERFEFNEKAPPSRRISAKENRYILRPETIESIFVMYRVTGNPKYRDMGWRIFEAIQRWCKTDCCYSGVVDVTKVPAEPNNSMQSFYLAETLKYLYLLFSDREDVSMDNYIWTTEAHPLPIISLKNQQPDGLMK